MTPFDPPGWVTALDEVCECLRSCLNVAVRSFLSDFWMLNFSKVTGEDDACMHCIYVYAYIYVYIHPIYTYYVRKITYKYYLFSIILLTFVVLVEYF